uniref:Uncharacterized protein n=1 Tax=Arundo donax TaxID=35708 RepID=A0A0A9B2Z7_ARUDO
MKLIHIPCNFETSSITFMYRKFRQKNNNRCLAIVENDVDHKEQDT